MELTLNVDLSNHTGTLVELHAFAAGDTYNPFYTDFSALTAAQIAAIATGSLNLVLRKTNSSGTIVASSSTFSAASRIATDGTSTPCPKLRQTSLLLNTQAMKDWFDEEAAKESPDFSQTVYVELADASTTYVSCTAPVILRNFTVGGSSTGYYTKEETDALLAQKQGTITVSAPIAKSGNAISIATASSSAKGVVQVGAGLSITDGVLAANVTSLPTVDSDLDDESTNAIQNKPVAEAFEGVTARLDSILKTSGGVETGRLKTVETKLSGIAEGAEVNVQSDWNQTDTTADDYIKNKPTIPSSSSIGNKWYTGTAISGKSENPTQFPESGIASANVGDMYLNTSESGVYSCTTAGAASVALWAYTCSIKGSTGDTGTSGQIKKTYTSVSQMQGDWSTADVKVGELVIIDSGSVTDVDNGKLYRKGSAQYEFLCDLSGNPGARWYSGTGITGTDTEPAVFPQSGVASANAGDMYLNTGTSAVYECTTRGAADAAKWKYVCVLKGTKGDTGAAGANGTDGSDGEDGADGEDGNKWYVGSALTGESTTPQFAPTSGVEAANIGDMYFNPTPCNIYECTVAGGPSVAKWKFLVCVKGADGTNGTNGADGEDGVDGEDGTDGNKWYSGTAITGVSTSPAVFENSGISTANTGDMYLNTDTGNCYTCVTSGTASVATWKYLLNLKGVAGDSGSAGNKWFTGTVVNFDTSGSVAVSGAIVGDMYLNTNTEKVYQCTAVTSGVQTWAFTCLIKGAAGTDGVDGHTIFYGIQVSAAGSYTISGAKVGDYYLNSSTRDFFRCVSVSGDTSAWELAFNISGITGPSSTLAGNVPKWSSSSATSLGSGYSVLTSLPASASAGAGSLMTAGAIYTALQDITDDFVSTSGSHVTGAVPTWNAGASIGAGYDVRTSVRLTGATDLCLVTEAAVRSAIGSGSKIEAPDTYTEGNIPTWNSGNKLANGLSKVTSVRDSASAVDTALPTEKAVRTALDGVSASITTKRLDEFATPDDTTTLNASTTAHGLCPKLDDNESHFLNGKGAFVSPAAFSEFTGSEPGLVPTSQGESTKFLRADGAWSAPTDEDFTLDIHGMNAGGAAAATDELAVYDGTDHKKKTVQQILSLPTYDVYFAQAGAFVPSKTNGATTTPLQFTSVTHDVVQFAAGSVDQSAEFDVVFPDDWDGSELKVRILWTPYAGTGSTNDWVRFRIGAQSYKEGDSVSTQVSTLVDIDDQMINTGVLHKTPASAAITVSGTIAEGNMVHFMLQRDADYHPSGGSALAADASVLGVQIQFKRGGDFTGWTTGA